ncbi:MAG: amidophosphoribosyltransferase [Candidatus Omnitrophota bacterium]
MKLSRGDKKEYCGIFGISGHDMAVDLTYLGLYSLQHRGEESCGIAVSSGRNIKQITGMGLVPEVLAPKKLKGLKGRTAIGHVRYSTTGSSILRNAQPFLINHSKFSVSIAHNGNLTNAEKLRRCMEKDGSIFQSTMDSEIILHLMVRSEKKTFEDRIIDAISQCEGAFSLLFLCEGKIVGVRDPYGFRPLCIGRKGSSYVLASETCSLDIIDAEYLRDVEPGEIVVIDPSGIKSIKPFDKKRPAQCVFEFIYFSRPDSIIFGDSVYRVRKDLGRQLAREFPVPADMVISIPDSGNYAALGYSEESGLPFEFGIVRNHYIGRTFIQPSPEMRRHGVKIKLNPIRSVLKGKRVVVVEDSIVRGTTTSGRVKEIREAGASEIHMRISCPPIKYPCFYGIDFPSRKELIANEFGDIDEIAREIGVDSLKYLSMEGMLSAIGDDIFCAACFNGVYPSKIKKKAMKQAFE